MLKGLSIAAFALLLAEVVAWPAVASACACIATVISSSEPSDRATGLARNQAILVTGALNPQSFELKDASGAAVEIDVDYGPSGHDCAPVWAELRPKQPLAAMTKYTVSVGPNPAVFGDSMPPHSFTFTTGTDLLPEPTLHAPKGRVSIIQDLPTGDDGVIGACHRDPIEACIGLDEGPDLEVIARHEGRIILRSLLATSSESVSFRDSFSELPDCFEFRRRAATGKRSEPLTLCGEALGVRPYRASDGEAPALLCHDGQFGPSDAGTSGAVSAPASDAGATTQASDAGVTSTSASTRDPAAPPAPANGTGVEASQSQAADDAAIRSAASDDQATHSEASGDGCSLRPSARALGSALLAPLVVIALARRRRRRAT